jgi:drug/metabolite transporter (DMT)-like permease
MAAQVVASGIAAVPLLLVVPLPSRAALPWLAGSAVCNLLVTLSLIRGYAHGGGFGFVYPVARAVSPVLVTFFAAVLLGERLGPAGYAGVGLVSAGVALFAGGPGERRPAALAYALVAGLFSAAYAICDAQGARLSPSVAGYGLAVSVVNGAVFGAVYRLQGGGPVRSALAAHIGVATFGAAAATTSYLLILWVWDRAPVAAGAALRDTSIVFAALIAVVVLKERLTRTRVIAVALVAAGAGCLRFA